MTEGREEGVAERSEWEARIGATASGGPSEIEANQTTRRPLNRGNKPHCANPYPAKERPRSSQNPRKPTHISYPIPLNLSRIAFVSPSTRSGPNFRATASEIGIGDSVVSLLSLNGRNRMIGSIAGMWVWLYVLIAPSTCFMPMKQNGQMTSDWGELWSGCVRGVGGRDC